MKILALFSVLLSTTAFAAKVGDQASFSGSIKLKNGAIYPAVLTMTVKQDLGDNKFNVETTQTVAGRTQSQTEVRSADEIGSDEMGNQIVANCQNYGGVTEAVVVGGDTIQTCKIAQNDNQLNTQIINFGAVPFMIVKFVQTNASNGTVTELGLVKFTHGQ